jgi:hypothetical protein
MSMGRLGYVRPGSFERRWDCGQWEMPDGFLASGGVKPEYGFQAGYGLVVVGVEKKSKQAEAGGD